MSSRVQNHVTGRLSLRPPQAESLARLVRALETAPEMLGKDRDAGGQSGYPGDPEKMVVIDAVRT